MQAPAKEVEEVEEDWEVAAEGNATPGAAAAARRAAEAAAAVDAAASKKSEGEAGRKHAPGLMHHSPLSCGSSRLPCGRTLYNR